MMQKIIDWLDRHLVAGWRDSWRWASVQFVPVLTAAMMAIAAYPDLIVMLAGMLGGSGRLQALVLVVALVIVAARLWDEEEHDGDE